MDFVNDYKNEITYSILKKLQQIDKERENGQRLNYWDLIRIFGKKLWEFTDSQNEIIDQYERTVINKDNSELALDSVIKNAVLRALEESEWVQKFAAKKLGISQRKMLYLIGKFQIKHPKWRKNK